MVKRACTLLASVVEAAFILWCVDILVRYLRQHGYADSSWLPGVYVLALAVVGYRFYVMLRAMERANKERPK